MSISTTWGATIMKLVIMDLPEEAGGIAAYGDQNIDYSGNEGVVLVMVRKAWQPTTYPLFFFGAVDHKSKSAPTTLIDASTALSMLESLELDRPSSVAAKMIKEAKAAVKRGEWP